MFLADAFKRSLSAQSAFVIIGFSFVVCLIGCWATFVLSSRQIEQHTLAQERAYMGERLHIARAIFERIEEAHTAAERRFTTLYDALSQEEVDRTFERVFDLHEDGTHRLSDEFFYGATFDARPVFGMAAFIAPGEMDAEHRRTLVAAFDAIREIGPAHRSALESLWFFTPRNDLIIFAPDRVDRLAFYRHEATADFDFQSSGFAQLVTPENNPEGAMRCTDLSRAVWDPDGSALVTGCQSPIRRDGEHIGAWGVTLPLNDTLLDLIETTDTLHTMFVATMSGELILSREMGFAETALPDQVGRLERIYQVPTVIGLIEQHDTASGAFISPTGGWIISYARLGEPNWVIVTLVDRRDLQGDVFAAALIGVVLMFILLALQAALIGFIYHKRVVRPLRALARGHGPESETASPLSDEERAALIAREDEVGVLAGSLERAQQDHDELVETLERRVAQRTVEYRRASEAKSVFLATMSHELRTPLNAIMGMLDVLALQALESDAARHVKVAHSSACALLKIIDDVLDFSKIEAGELSLENIPFDPYAVFEQHLEGIRGVAETKGLKLTAALSEDLPDSIIGDPTRVGQILMNLLGNAVKFTEQGEVSLQVDYDVKTQSLYAEVLDTGIGLDPDAAPKLFTRFSQADDSTTRRFGGTGLGLAICRELVEAMDGEIGAENRADGGSRFWFKIKAPISDKAPVAKPRGAQTRRTDGYAMNVLVADDNLNNQEVAQALLDAAGHAVTLVDDGAQAIEALETSEFDLLLLDIQMPVLDGVETTKRIRAHKDLRVASTPIIGLTANAIVSAHEKFKAAGMDDVLTKPIRLDALFVALRKFAQWSDEGAGGGGEDAEDADDADFSDEDFDAGPLSRSA